MQESKRNSEQETHETATPLPLQHEAAPEHHSEQHKDKNDKIVFQAMPDLSEEEAYQQLQQQNRRRLIGAGVVTLAVAGLFAAITSGGSDSASDAASSPNLTGSTQVAAPALAVASQPEVAVPVPTTDHVETASDIPQLPALYDTPSSASVDSEEVPTVAQSDIAEPIADAPAAPMQRSSAQQAQEAAAKAAAQRLAREQQSAANASRAKQAALEKRQAEQARLQLQNEQKQEQQRAQAAAQQRETTKAIASGKGSLMVQAGAFKTPAQAQKVQKQLQAMGFNARITEVKTDKGTFLRVQAGPFADRNAANAAAARMKGKGLGGMVVGK